MSGSAGLSHRRGRGRAPDACRAARCSLDLGRPRAQWSLTLDPRVSAGVACDVNAPAATTQLSTVAGSVGAVRVGDRSAVASRPPLPERCRRRTAAPRLRPRPRTRLRYRCRRNACKAKLATEHGHSASCVRQPEHRPSDSRRCFAKARSALPGWRMNWITVSITSDSRSGVLATISPDFCRCNAPDLRYSITSISAGFSAERRTWGMIGRRRCVRGALEVLGSVTAGFSRVRRGASDW